MVCHHDPAGHLVATSGEKDLVEVASVSAGSVDDQVAPEHSVGGLVWMMAEGLMLCYYLPPQASDATAEASRSGHVVRVFVRVAGCMVASVGTVTTLVSYDLLAQDLLAAAVRTRYRKRP